MPEFKKKTALGLRDLPEYGQECTHVLLTHSEYDGLLAKVACAERDVRAVYTAASQKIAQAERNSAQAKEAAYAEVDAVQKDLEEACRKIEYLNGLNKNLLRIARERANADRKLRPKKTHADLSYHVKNRPVGQQSQFDPCICCTRFADLPFHSARDLSGNSKRN